MTAGRAEHGGMKAELTAENANARGVRRLLLARIDEALASLSGKRISDKGIHDARKSLKRARAALRLMREVIPEAAYRRENAALRDVARPLSAARDARILIDSLGQLEKLYGAPARASIPAAFRRELKRAQAAASRSSVRNPAMLCEALETSRRRIEKWRIGNEGWQELSVGLERVYRHARRALKQSRNDCTPAALHEWRKQTKYLWYQLQILEPAWPGKLGELADRAHALSDYLGYDHDLAVLREKAEEHARLFDGEGGPAALLALIDRCQARLRAKAFRAGKRIYDEKPAALVTQIGRRWRRWAAPEDASAASG